MVLLNLNGTLNQELQMENKNQPAHFIVCPDCHKHGHIVYSDGHCSKPLWSYLEAREEVIQASMRYKLTAAEIPALAKQIFEAEFLSPFCLCFDHRIRGGEVFLWIPGRPRPAELEGTTTRDLQLEANSSMSLEIPGAARPRGSSILFDLYLP